MEVLFEDENQVAVVRLTYRTEIEALLTILTRIAAELSWQPGNQLHVRKNAAEHLAVRVGSTEAGGLQVVYGTRVSALPYQKVWPELGVSDHTAIAHVTILALAKEYRRRPHLFGSLCVELWRCCVAQGVEHIVIKATPPTLRLYRRIGWPLEIIGDLRPHWGEDCYLCRMGVREVAQALSEKAGRSASHRALVEQAYRDDPYVLPLTDTACV